MTHQITADLRFSITPEWVLDADISDRAVRIYSILARYADNESLEAFPSRETLAKRARCHAKSIDRAVDELVNIGAIVKTHRKANNGFQSNVYTLRRVQTTQSLPRDTPVPTLGTPLSPPRDTGVQLTITTELEPVNDIKSAFAQFWDVYPKKDDKRPAQRSFEKALKRETFDVILEGAVRYRDDANRDANYTKNPSTWLNADARENGPLPVRVAVNEWGKPLRPAADLPSARLWVKKMHDLGEHWECRPGEFGCE